MKTIPLLLASMLLASTAYAQSFAIDGTEGTRLDATPVATFNEPWALSFLPDGSMLVTEKSGTLQLVAPDGAKRAVSGVPEVAYAGQGGLGDVVLHPDFADNQIIYISYAEAGGDGAGAVVIRARLSMVDGPALTEITRIWEQPKVSGRGHYAHKIALDSEGYLFITSGDRQKQTPAQDLSNNLGTIVRLNDDGSVPADNPIQNQGEIAKTFWSVGHRNPLGIDFDAQGRLWAHEMGPRHGDELNLINAGGNYGWPVVSNGDNYSGVPIPDHDTRPEFNAPKAFWVPSIAPSGLVMYDGDVFADWRGDALIGGLVSQALIHVDIDGDTAREAERFEWGQRVRDVEQGPDGALYVLEDGDEGRMLRLMPAG